MSTVEEREAMHEASRALNDHLMREAKRLRWQRRNRLDAKYAARRWPKVVRIEVHPDLEAGVLERAKSDSISRPLFQYRMFRSASGWQHEDMGCEGWLSRASCHHVKELNMETTTLVPASGNVLALIEEIEDEEIVAAIGKQIEKSWVYEFPQGNSTVRGLSSVGVEQAARELAKEGEAIRQLDVKIEYEDENEARFIAQAGRFAISPDGKEVLLDVAIRGKRQAKKMKLRNGDYQDDEHWYEKGITKAVRNAKLALLPEKVKAFVLVEAAKAGRVRQVDNARQQPQARVNAPARHTNNVDPATCDHVASFDEKSTLMVCGKCGVVLEEPEPGQKPLV